MKEEIWKDVVGYEDRYQVSNIGRVRSKDLLLHKSDGKTELRKGRIVKFELSKSGYWQYLFSNGTIEKRKLMRIHRVVAMAFIPNPENKPCIDHINTIRTDNRTENLRWCTQAENCRNPITMTRCRKKGEYTNSAETRRKIGFASLGRRASDETREKLVLRGWAVVMFDLDGKFIKEFRTSSKAAKELGICHSHITASCSGTRKSTGGYQWMWKKDWNGNDILPKPTNKKHVYVMTEKRKAATKRGLKSSIEKTSVPINVYRIDGAFVCECSSLSDAARKFNTNSGSVCRVCSGKYKHSKGYIFKYKSNDKRRQ